MSVFDVQFTSLRQDWVTPDDLFLPIAAEFAFTLDAAANSENTRAVDFFSEADDGMVQDWGKNIVWLNPPYHGVYKLKDWIVKAHNAALRGALVVMLVPARTNTSWFQDYCLPAEVRFIRGRPKFIGARHGLPWPLCLVIFRPRAAQLEAA